MSSLTPCPGKRLPLLLLSVSLVIVARSQPIPTVSTNAPICAGAPLLALFETSNTAVSWHWAGPNGFASSLQNPSISNPVIAAAGLYSVTVSDIGGLTATAAIEVKIHQSGPMACNDHVIVSLDDQGQAVILPQTVLQGNYEFEFYTTTLYNAQGLNLGNQANCAMIGTSLIYKVTDTCSANSCWGHLLIQDKLPPALTCGDIPFSCAIENFSPDYLLHELSIAAAYPAVAENCGVVNLIYADQFFDLPCAQPANGISNSSAWLRRDWVATDASGNSATCPQIFYFMRKHLSDVLLPADTVISCQHPVTDPVATGAPYISEYGHPFPVFPNNAYCEMDAGYSDEVIDVCDGTRKILRTWTITEDCPNTGAPDFLIHPQWIIIMDNQGPVFSCPPQVTVSIDPFTCCAMTDLPDVVLTDTCSRINQIDGIIQTYDIWTGDSSATYGITGILATFPNNNLWASDTLGHFDVSPCLSQGTHTVTYRASDDCGNANTCSFKLIVEDKVPPVVACDTYTKVALGADGLAEVFATTFDDGSFDHCCATQFYARRQDGACNGTADFSPTVWFCCSDIGDTVRVVFRAFDCADNFNDCMVQVFVEDKIRPVCNAPANMTVDCALFDPTLDSYGFAEAIDNCCLDTILAFVNYNQFDSICNRGTIYRTFRAIDCSGNSSQCSQRIVVDYKQYFYLKMPDDKIVNSCDGTGNYGEPTIHFEDCELIGISYEDIVYTVVPEGCYRIDRHWKIINWCTYNPNGACIEIPNPDISQQRPFVLPGPIISPIGTSSPWSPTYTFINPTDSAATNYSIFWDANANCYEYKQMILVFDTKDPIIEDCPVSPLQICDQTTNNAALWNDTPWWDAAILSHDLCEGPADLSITAYDACTGSQVRFRFLLLLDLDNNGSMETVINSNTPPPAGMVYFNNALNPNFSGGELRPFDLRAVPLNQKYNFAIHETVVGNKRMAAVRWKTATQLPIPGNPFGLSGITPELPYGRHKIKWLVEDGCTNESFCEYVFDVKDCKPPTVVCLNGLSVNISATGTAQLWASDFLQYTTDNCTPTPYLKLGIRKSGTGTGFPVDGNGDPITGISFDCTEIGTQPVELWALDLAGNADYCETIIIVQDNLGACGASGQISGKIKTETQEGVAAVTLEVAGSSNVAPSFGFFETSDTSGYYQFNAIPMPSNITLTPEKDDHPVNGVTTFDLVEISKHVLGVKPLASPFRMIAADANRSNSITSFDIVELRKLILGIYTDLPSNTSWRFIDKNYAFPDIFNPFQEEFPENKNVLDLSDNQLNTDFVAVKIGDVNNSAVLSVNQEAGSRMEQPLCSFTVSPSSVGLIQEGETVDLMIQSPPDLVGFQFTLNFKGLEVLEVIPLENMQNDFFAIFSNKAAMTIACDQAGKTAFKLKCKALQLGYVHQMLSIGSNITTAEAYKTLEHAMVWRPSLQFPMPNQFAVYPAQPNPFTDRASISFFMPKSGEATLKVTDENGRLVSYQKQDFQNGFNVFEVDFQQNDASSILFYKIETADGNGAGKMIRSR